MYYRNFILLLIIILTTKNTIAQNDNCPNSIQTHLRIGITARVSVGPPNNVRDTPSTSGQLVGEIPGGEEITILAGPNCESIYTWWMVEYKGLVGWTAEGNGTDRWIEPVSTVTRPSANLIAITDPNGSIRILSPDLTYNEVIVNGSFNSYPTWSPDGTQIAYILESRKVLTYDMHNGESANVYTTDELLRLNQGVELRLARWPLDNSGIYFYQDGGSPAWRNILCTPFNGLVNQTYCNDFKVGSWTGGFDRSKQGQIITVSYNQMDGKGAIIILNDGQAKNLTSSSSFLPIGLSWSPDGKYIAFYQNGYLIKMLADGSDQLKLTKAVPSSFPTSSWSSDGSRIAFEHKGGIWIENSDGKESPKYLVDGQNPSWQP